MRLGTEPIFARLAAALAAALLVLLGALAPGRAAFGAEPVAGEYDLKAAFVYQFVHFTEWPADAFEDDGDEPSPIVVAVVGDDPFRGSLERAVRGKTVQGRPLVYVHFANANAVGQCHVMFVSASERQRIGQVAAAARQFRALTVGDVEEFTRDGGMIRFVTQNKKVRFEIRRKSVEAAGLRLRAQLLRVAEIYRE
jgi:hypothetical protein